MGKWIKIEGARASDGADSGERSDLYEADLGEGLKEATARGFAPGVISVLEGELYELKSRVATSRPGADLVELRWASADKGNGRSRDGVPRRDGDEEWSLEGSVDEVRADQFLNANGDSWSASWDIPEDEVLRQPRTRLVWKKWLKKVHIEKVEDKAMARRRSLPTAKEDALAMAQSYTTGAGTFESGGPRNGCVLDGTDFGKCWLCVDVQVEPDGGLVLRTAKFEYRPGGWNLHAYPAPGGGGS